MGITAAGLYNHFESKEQILWEIIGGVLNRLQKLVIAEMSQDAPALTRFRNILKLHICFTIENATETKIINEDGHFLSDRLYAAAQERQRAEKRHAELERQSVAARQLQAAREDAEFQSYLRLFFGHSESEVIVAHSLWLAASDTRRKNLYASARRSFDAHSGTSRVLQHMRSGQSGGAKDEQGIAERERIEAELAILARPQPKLFTLEDCLQKQALWQLERLGRL